MPIPVLPREIIVEIIKYLKPAMNILLVSGWFTNAVFTHCIESHTICRGGTAGRFANARHMVVRNVSDFSCKINPISLTLLGSTTISEDRLVSMTRLTSLAIRSVADISRLVNLRSLLAHGSISLGGLALTQLTLISGKPHTVNMSSLKCLHLIDTQAPELVNVQLDSLTSVNTVIPESYKQHTRNITQLTALWEDMPDGFTDLPKLTSLTIQGIPAHVITKLTTLTHLCVTHSLYYPNIKGSDLRGLMLQSLSFQIPKEKIPCAHMTQLHTLKTCGNAISDDDIKHLTSLTNLHLCGFVDDESSITNYGIHALTNLKELEIHYNRYITDRGVRHLVLIQKISTLRSKLTRAGVDGIYEYRYARYGDRGDKIGGIWA